MRRNLLLVSVILLSVFAYADEWKKEYTVGASPEVRIGTNDGSIEIRRGGSKIEALVQTEGYKIGPGDVHVYDRQDGDRVSLDVNAPQHNFVFSFGNRYIHIILNVPASTKLDLRSGDGSIRVYGIQAPANLSTGDGRIEVSDFAGPLRAHTSDGSVRVEGRFDDLDLSTGDGSIHCLVRPGSKMKNEWRIRSGDGSVTLQIPEDLAADLYAHTSDGRIMTNLPGAIRPASSDDEDTRHDIRARLNGGGQYKFSVETGDGSIHISK